MVIRHAAPRGYSLASLLDSAEQRPRLSKAALVGIGAAVLLHLGLIAYLYDQQVVAEPDVVAEAPTIDIGAVRFQNPQPRHPAQPQPRTVQPRPPRLDRTEADPAQADQSTAPLAVTPLPGPQPLPLEPPTAAAGPATPAGPPVISDPQWISRPTAEELARAYPARAIAMDREGSARLQCRVTLAGSVTDCKVAAETPSNFGFGQAARTLSKRFRMSPRLEDGRPVDGATVTISLRFVLNR